MRWYKRADLLYYLIKKFKENLSIFILAVGAGSLFLLNIVLKKNLTPIEFGQFALLLTYITIINSFGLFGVDQLLIRKSKIDVKSGYLQVNSSVTSLIFLAVVFSSLFALIFYLLNFYESLFTLILISVFGVLTMLIYNTLRISKNFIYAQLVNVLWKFSLLTFTILYLQFTDHNSLNYYLLQKVLLIFLLIPVILFIPILFKNIRFSQLSLKAISKSDIILCLFFFVSLLSISFIGQADRFLVEYIFNDLAKVGDYIFLSSIIIFPFGFAQNYFGFKFLGDFKNSESPKKLLKEKIKSAVLASFLLIIISIFSIFILFKFKMINFELINTNKILIIIFVLTGVLKVFYSVASSLMGSLGNILLIKKANGISFILTITLVISSFSFLNNSEMIAFLFLILWLTRSSIWYYFVKIDNYEN